VLGEGGKEANERFLASGEKKGGVEQYLLGGRKEAWCSSHIPMG